MKFALVDKNVSGRDIAIARVDGYKIVDAKFKGELSGEVKDLRKKPKKKASKKTE